MPHITIKPAFSSHEPEKQCKEHKQKNMIKQRRVIIIPKCMGDVIIIPKCMGDTRFSVVALW